MQTMISRAQVIAPIADSEAYIVGDREQMSGADEDRALNLKAAYRQLFKENRDLDFHHNQSLDSAYLNGRLTTRDLVRELICSDMYINFILSLNSNYRFVDICFERVLGRPATQQEKFTWSSLLASKGLDEFALELTESDEYSEAFGDFKVPFRRSQKLSSSNQGLPALPKELSIQRYQGEGNYNQMFGFYRPLPKIVFKLGAIFAVAGSIELVRILAAIIWAAYSTGL